MERSIFEVSIESDPARSRFAPLCDQDKAIEVEGRSDGRAITLKQRREFLMAQAIDPPL